MKKGISLVSLIIAIIIMAMLVGIVAGVGGNSLSLLDLNKFALELLNVQNEADEYYLRHNMYPVSMSIEFDISNLNDNEKLQFQNEPVTNNIMQFKVLDLQLMGITDNEYGNNKKVNDIYVISELTKKVYYLLGVSYEGKTYFTLSQDLYDQVNITPVKSTNSNEIVRCDVIFELSEVEYTKNPISVNVKLPIEATINSINVTGLKSISEEKIENVYKVVTINETSADLTGNYTITVNYTYNSVTKDVSYMVNNFDNIPPVVTTTETIDNDLKIISITPLDEQSGIKVMKYETAIVEDEAYFENYGKTIVNNKIIVNKDSVYTIYVQDNAGNNVILN